MNLSHDGSINTTNVVIQNLNKLQNTKFVSLSETANNINDEMIDIYNKQYSLLMAVSGVYNICQGI